MAMAMDGRVLNILKPTTWAGWRTVLGPRSWALGGRPVHRWVIATTSSSFLDSFSFPSHSQLFQLLTASTHFPPVKRILRHTPVPRSPGLRLRYSPWLFLLLNSRRYVSLRGSGLGVCGCPVLCCRLERLSERDGPICFYSLFAFGPEWALAVSSHSVTALCYNEHRLLCSYFGEEVSLSTVLRALRCFVSWTLPMCCWILEDYLCSMFSGLSTERALAISALALRLLLEAGCLGPS